MKFQRSFRITIDPKDGFPPIVITDPFTCQFWVQRNTMSSLNHMSLDIYNLGQATRNRIFQDRFQILNRTVVFEAGYDTLSTVFSGIIFEANSSRDRTNIITRIEARDGHYDVSTNKTFQTIQSKTLKDVFNFLIGQFSNDPLSNLELGAIGNYDQPTNRPVALNGNTYDLLKSYSQNQVFIDMGKVYVLQNTEVLDDIIPIINPSTGLLETPRRDDGFLTITTLFEPNINIGRMVRLQSEILPIYNGDYKVMGVMHQGMISQAVCGVARSIFNLYVGNNQFVKVATP